MAAEKGTNDEHSTHAKEEMDLQYSIDENPPWYTCLILGFQHYVMMFGGTLTLPLLMAPAMCMGNDNVAVAEILCTVLFMSGIITILQSFVGCRLPVLQGGTFTLLTPTFAILNLEQWKCPEIVDHPASANNTTTEDPPIIAGSDEHKEIWQMRMREIQGAIILSSLFEVLIGLTGLLGIILRFIGPLAIAPTISLIGLPLFGTANDLASQNWWIAMMTIVFIAIFSQYLRNVSFPCPSYDNKRKRCTKFGYPLFQLFPVILSTFIAWAVCAILTVTDAIPNDVNHWAYGARTDIKMQILDDAKWFRFPYPGQWGTPTFSTAAVFGMLAGILSGMVESIGDYYACARLCGAPPPPTHAINRGIFIEGLGCVLAGCWGSGTATATYSGNIGAIGITKVGSRSVMYCAGFIMLLFGMFGKFGAVFVTIPEPVIGGSLMVSIGMLVAIGIANLQFVDLNSARNLFVIGFSFFFGLSLPQWVENNTDTINTGNDVLDQIITVLLSTSMFVGGVIGFIFDNTIPGTQEERGIMKWRVQEMTSEDGSSSLTTYDIPYITKYLKQWKWLEYVPISPTYNPDVYKWNCRNRKEKKIEVVKDEVVDSLSMDEYGHVHYKL